MKVGARIVICQLFLCLTACSGGNSAKNIFSSAPQLIRVFNGTNLGFYTATGNYGFQNKASSIVTLTQDYGETQQFVQNTNNGYFYFGTTMCSTNCDLVIALNGYNGSYRSGSFGSSSTSLGSSGSTAGLAIDVTDNRIFAADYTNGYVYVLDASTGVFDAGPIIPPHLLGSLYAGVDTYNRRVIFSETTVGAVWVMDGTNNTSVATALTPLSLTSGSCTAGSVSLVSVNSGSHIAYILCGSVVIYVGTNGVPNYQFGSLAASTFPLANISAGTDMIYDSVGTMNVVTGGNFVTGIDALTGGARVSMDLTGGNCGFGTLDLEGIAYNFNNNTLYVADAANNKVYLLDGSTLNFKNGTCTTSSFSTPDVSMPKRISFF